MKVNDILIVDIIKQDAFGRGVSKYNNFVIFVNGSLPNEKAKIIIKQIKKNYAEADTVETFKSSKSRRTYDCLYYDKCGGCNIGHQNYDDQIQYKINKVKELLNVDYIDSIKSNELNYRNKIVLRVNNNKVGLYKKSSNSIIEIDNCKISNNKINKIITKLNDFKYLNNINEITIRALDETMISFITNKNINKQILEYFNFIESIYINNKHALGKKSISINLLNIKFEVSNTSFFQVNLEGTIKLYNKIIEYSNLNKDDNVLDLYCGVGTISLLLAKHCKNVIGIELIEDAIKNANINKKLNNINNVNFICGRVEETINNNMLIDVLILDPPRSGVDLKSINIIRELMPKKIIYVSCNPDTLKRDIENLKVYKIEKVSIIDMFPNTYHIETVCLLTKI